LGTFSVGIDGIEISRDGNWLYYGAMSHDTMYKLPMKALRDAQLGAADLAKQIQAIGRKPLNDGITVDAQDNILITDSGIPAYIDQLARPPAREKLKAAAPYKIYRFKP
jgi:sugar lactone lactonase YvrE